jgi:hypothetical protein
MTGVRQAKHRRMKFKKVRTGCSGRTQSRIGDLKIGMSPAEVLSILED